MLAVKSIVCGCLVVVSCATALAQENPAVMKLAGGKLQLTAPGSWVRKRPQTAIVEHEFSIPAAKDDNAEGRLTVMAAGALTAAAHHTRPRA